MRAVVGPADFLRAVSALGATDAGAENIARLLGYEIRSPAVKVDEQEKSTTIGPTAKDVARQADAKPATDDAPERFGEVPVVLEETPNAERSATPPTWWESTRPLDEEVPGQAWANPAPDPLFAPERQRDVLRALTSRRRIGRRVDVMALTQLLARHEPYLEPPRLSETRSARSAAVIALRSSFLETYQLDVEDLAQRLATLLGKGSVSLDWSSDLPRELPKVELVVIVAQARTIAAGARPGGDWISALRRARAARTAVVALSPETLRIELFKPLRLLEWSRRTRAANIERRYPPAGSATDGPSRLASLLSPAVRVEPALMRSVRVQLLPEYGPEIEAQLAEGALVASSNRLGITLKPNKRRELLGQLGTSILSKKAFELVRSFHTAATPVQTLEEKITRLAHQQEDDWETQVASELRRATKAVSQLRPGLARWVSRAAGQLSNTLLKQPAFVEAATRAEAVLGTAVPRAAEAPALSGETAEFLGSLPDKAPGEVEVLFVDPETAREESLSPGLWPMPSFQLAWMRRQLASETNAELQIAVCLAPALASRFIGFLERRKGYHVRHATPEKLAELLERASVVILAFDDPGKAGVLQRAADDPSFLGILLTQSAPPAAEQTVLRPLVEVVSLDEPRLHSILETLVSYASGGSALRVVTRRASAHASRQRLSLPASAIPELGCSTSEGTKFGADRTEMDLPRRAFTIHHFNELVARAHVVPELWFARLCRSACVVRCSDGDRSGCLVAGEYAVSRTRGSTGTRALEVGDSVELIVAGGSRIAASVVNVAGEICISRAARGRANGFWIDAEEAPTLAGLAAAITLDDGPDRPHLLWGWAELQSDGTSKLTIQRPSLEAPSPAQLFRGLSVIVGGRYAGHAIELEQGPGGVWSGRLCAVPKHLLVPNAERAVESGPVAPSLLWAPPPPPTGDQQVTSIDPRVEQNHVAGRLPCPPRPPAPVGWANWKGGVPPALAAFAMSLLNDSAGFPMGSFVQARVEGQLVAARVEWHDLQGSTGKRGCFRGTALFFPSETASSPVLSKGLSGPAVRRWQQFLRRQGASTIAVDGVFGDATAAATRDFQQARRLVADGIVGDLTYRAARELGFDEQDDGREDDGLTTWLVALSQAPTAEIAAKALHELRPESGEVVKGFPQIRGSRLVFRTSHSIVERLLRRRRLGELTELAGLGIDWLAEEQREPDEMDPQRGRFGSLPERNGRRLTALVKSDGRRYLATLTLTSVDSAPSLEGSVTFHLHPTFKNVTRRVPVKNGRATLTLDVWGWFTVGAQCEDGTRLELDIGDVPRPSAKR